MDWNIHAWSRMSQLNQSDSTVSLETNEVMTWSQPPPFLKSLGGARTNAGLMSLKRRVSVDGGSQ